MKYVKLFAVMVFHPLVAFEYMKKDREKRFNYLPIIIILLLMVFTKIFSMYVTHYPLRTVNLRNANLLTECLMVVVPIVTWAVASYAVTTIMSGEVMFRECLLACCYSLLPYIVIHIPLTIATNAMDAGQAGMYNTINNLALFWTLLLLFVNLKEMNHYTMFKAIGVVVIAICAMLLIWASIALVAALTMRFVNFVTEVIEEVQYKLIY